MVMCGNMLLYGRFLWNSVVTCVVTCPKNGNMCQKVQYQPGFYGVYLRASKEDFDPRVMVDQAEGLCHQITLHFGRLNIETGALYYCI